MLATFRREMDEALPTEFLRAVEEARLERVKLGPLTIAAIHELLRTRAGVNLPRPTLLRQRTRNAGRSTATVAAAARLDAKTAVTAVAERTSTTQSALAPEHAPRQNAKREPAAGTARSATRVLRGYWA